jgi:hypothetical protein
MLIAGRQGVNMKENRLMKDCGEILYNRALQIIPFMLKALCLEWKISTKGLCKIYISSGLDHKNRLIIF